MNHFRSANAHRSPPSRALRLGKRTLGLLACLVALSPLAVAAQAVPEPALAAPRARALEGIVFKCSAPTLARLEPELIAYFASVGVDTRLLTRTADKPDTLSYTLMPALADGNTLTLIDRPELGLRDALVELPAAKGTTRTVLTVSKGEIAYAMLQTGRATVFTGSACDVQALVDQVGIRQNTVAWAERLNWRWPEGGSAAWNKKYWNKGDLVKGMPLYAAVNDAFIHQDKYAIGCYTATKLVVLQGVLDYYQRVKKDPAGLALVQARLLQDGRPLSFIEPGLMWSFESTFTDYDRVREGKLLALQQGVAAKNFIPGDWAYFLNTDPVTYEKTGYEGSNAIYLGRDRFDDYYNDHHHFYSYKEKLDEVYQWRNKVFSASRDVAKVTPLSAVDLAKLSQTPEQGGLLLALRAVPHLFGYQPLPALRPLAGSLTQ